MIWRVCLALSVIVLCAGYAAALRIITGRTHKTGNALYASFAGVITACIIIFIPIFSRVFAGEAWGPLKCFLISTHSAIRLFMVDGEFAEIKESLAEAGIESGTFYKLYTSFTAFLFVNAPLLTFSFIFSFLRRINDRIHYLLGIWKNCYVFSDLNERSMTLAEDLHGKGIQIVFTDVFQTNSEESAELADRAERLGAVCLHKDILDMNFSSFLRGGKALHFYIMGSSRSENLTQSLKLIEKYKDRENTRLFYFSDDENSDLQFSAVDKGKIRVKRVNMARVLIERMLYEDGYKLFTGAQEGSDGVRRIRAVIVGLGRHGCNMLRALSWFCQMDGYELEIDAFDKDPLIQEKLELICPDLFSGKYNGKKDPGEAIYTITIHPGVDVETRRFKEEIEKLPETNYIVTALGNDERNLQTSVMLRMLFTRMNKDPKHPQIRAIIYNSEERKALEGAHNFTGASYNIDFFGDLESTYCEKVIINSELEETALTLHKGWADEALTEEEKERLFWDYEYNYRSSVASAIHQEAVARLEELGLHHEEDNEEHRRWNAYMRSEGYILSGGFKEKDHMARTHGDLVSNEVLRRNKEEFEKDQRIKEAFKQKK